MSGTHGSFESWMSRLDALVSARTGLSIYDLPDMCFRDWYDEDFSPAEAFGLVRDEAGF